MQAAVCRAYGAPLELEELSLDTPHAGELLVDVKACAICHSDITYIEGGWGGKLPALYGHEAAGVVRATGPDTPGFAPGDRVVVTLIRSCGACRRCARGEQVLCEGRVGPSGRPVIFDASGAPVIQAMAVGGFAEQVLVHHSQVARLPDEMGFVTASLLGCGVITGVGAVLNAAGVAAGESVVVIGAGGVGLNCVQGSALAGAHPIVAVDVVASKLDAARRFGATHTALANGDVSAVVSGATDGRMADHVFVSVGAPSAIEQGLALMARGGQTVIVGMADTGATVTIDPVTLAAASQRIIGTKMGQTRVQSDIPRLLGLVRAGRLELDALVSGTYPLERINEAIAAVVRGEALRNVVTFP